MCVCVSVYVCIYVCLGVLCLCLGVLCVYSLCMCVWVFVSACVCVSVANRLFVSAHRLSNIFSTNLIRTKGSIGHAFTIKHQSSKLSPFWST